MPHAGMLPCPHAYMLPFSHTLRSHLATNPHPIPPPPMSCLYLVVQGTLMWSSCPPHGAAPSILTNQSTTSGPCCSQSARTCHP
ncbi:unnamed protein product [Closterium sp. NIES-54]